MARQLVESMSGPWTPEDYRDTYTDRVNELIEAKKNDEEFQPAAGPPAATNVSDLTAALQASVEAAKKSRQAKPGGSKRGKAPGASKAGTKSPPGKASGKKTPAKQGTTARQQRRKPAA